MHGEITTSVGERAYRGAFRRHEGEPADATRPPGTGACPYKGLAFFDAEDEAFFCGRDRLIDELVARLAVSRFVAVIGPSGSGKSSLVRAGLIPALQRGILPEVRGWETVLVGPGDAAEFEQVVARDPLRSGARHRVTVVVDHLEELFTTELEDVRSAFLAAIVQACTAPKGWATIVVVFRGDFYDRFAAYPAFARAARG